MEQTNDLLQMDGYIQTDTVETVVSVRFEKREGTGTYSTFSSSGISGMPLSFSVLSAVRKTIMGLSLHATRNWIDDE